MRGLRFGIRFCVCLGSRFGSTGVHFRIQSGVRFRVMVWTHTDARINIKIIIQGNVEVCARIVGNVFAAVACAVRLCGQKCP